MKTPAELRKSLRGIVVAMTTHFKDDYSLDLDAMKRLTEFYVEQSVPTVIVTGSTGEFSALTDEERKAVHKTVVDAADGKMTVIAGTAHSGSDICLELTKHAADIGADGVMITPPYYGTNGGGFPMIMNHYDRVTSATDIGVVIYFSSAVLWQVQDVLANPAMMLDLIDACNGNAASFKDSSGNFRFHREVCMMLKDKVAVMGSGGMSNFLFGQRYGSQCYVTGLANIWPKVEIEFCDHMFNNEYDKAEKMVKQKDLPYLRVCASTKRYFACVKALLEMVGLPGGPMRAPLKACTAEQREELRRVCTEIGLM